MSNKLPAFQFYPADWRKDPAVQSLSYHDRGVWFEILCLMHESEQRGKLLLNGKPMPDEALSRLLGLDKQILTKTLTTLLDYGVASRDNQGALVNRRMVNDEKLRQIRTEAGKKGGNPSLLNKRKDKDLGNLVNQNSTPSFSSSSSFANNLNGSGSSSNARASGKPPPPAADNFQSKRQWEELTAEEKAMSKKDFAEHLQKTFPDQNVRTVSSKLKKWCEANKKDFVRERLKGWLSGEGQTLDDEFLEAFGGDETTVPPWQKAINDCDLCDEKGLTGNGGRLTPCDHKQVKK